MRLDNKDSEPKAQVTGYLHFQNKIKIFKRRLIKQYSVISQHQNKNKCFFTKGQLHTTKLKNTKIHCKLFFSVIDRFQKHLSHFGQNV